MGINPDTVDIIIPLVEPVRLIKKRFKDSAIEKASRNLSVRTDINILDYDCAEFINTLLREIFQKYEQGELNSSILPSTRILIRDGLDAVAARKLSNETFALVTDAISTFVPNAKFDSNDVYRYTFCNDCDLYVSHPYQENIRKMNEGFIGSSY